MQAKECKPEILEKIITIVYRYMDYWIPICVLISFPVWILPGLLYYLTMKMIEAWRCTVAIGKTFMNLKPTTSELSYAILRGNGRYLRDQGENVHKKQFYDYTSRRFMSIGDFDSQTKIIELQCESEIGLNFFVELIHPENVVGVHGNKQSLKLFKNLYRRIISTEYELVGEPVGYDCLLLFNFKNKIKESKEERGIDLLKIIAYCRYHMHPNGYLVFGDYFEEGQVNTFIDLFRAFRLKVVEQQDITKNIQYAQKFENKHTRCQQRWIDKVLKSRANSVKTKIQTKFIVLIVEKEL